MKLQPSLPVMTELVDFPLSAAEVFSLFYDQEYSIWLDSGMDKDKLGRYSFITANPFLVFKSQGQEWSLTYHDGKVITHEGNPFNVLQDLLKSYNLPRHPLTPFPAGAAGYFAYDAGWQLEKLPNTAVNDVPVPDIVLGFYDWVITFDHLYDKVYLSAAGFPETDPHARYESAVAKVTAIRQKLLSLKSGDMVEQPPARGEITDLRSNFTREEYCRAIVKAKEYIAAGDIYQVNLSQRFQFYISKDPFSIFLKLRSLNPAPFAAYLNLGDLKVASSSPERFIKIRNGQVETRPIKGTRRRGATPKQDLALRESLLASEKDRAELVMIVDLERNDLGRVCRFGSVKVPELFHLETYATVFHLVATVTGELLPGLDSIDCLKATFPGGSITGAPKIRSMEIIEELEGVKRGIYTGSIGYLAFTGDMDTNIVIRTLVIKGKTGLLQVGGGIVADSQPDKEYQETLDKAKALLMALGLKQPQAENR